MCVCVESYMGVDKRPVGHGLGHGVGHGVRYDLPYGAPYDLPVTNFLTLASAVNLCKQRAPSICHSYDSFLSSWRRFAGIFLADSW